MFSRPVRTIDRVTPHALDAKTIPRSSILSTFNPTAVKSKLTTVLKTVACVQSNRCVGIYPFKMISARAGAMQRTANTSP